MHRSLSSSRFGKFTKKITDKLHVTHKSGSVEPNHEVSSSSSDHFLSEITPEVIQHLQTQWQEGERRPTAALVFAIRQYLDFMKPYFQDVRGVGFSHSGHILTQLQAAAKSEERERAEFEVDVDLYNDKEKYQQQDDEAQTAYRKSLQEHEAKAGELRKAIQDIDQKKSDITNENVILNLKNLVSFQRIHDEISEQLRETQNILDERGGCAKLFCCSGSREIDKLHEKQTQLERKRDKLDSEDLETIRKQLMKDLDSQRKNHRNREDELAKQIPQLDNQPHLKMIEAAAQMDSDQSEYYHQVSNSFMLRLIRLYAFVIKLQEALSAKVEKAVVKDSEKTPLLEGSAAMENLVKIKPLVDAFLSELGLQLAAFYCKDPGQFNFEDYDKRYQGLNKQERRDLLADNTPEEVIKKVFPHFKERSLKSVSGQLSQDVSPPQNTGAALRR